MNTEDKFEVEIGNLIFFDHMKSLTWTVFLTLEDARIRNPNKSYIIDLVPGDLCLVVDEISNVYILFHLDKKLFTRITKHYSTSFYYKKL